MLQQKKYLHNSEETRKKAGKSPSLVTQEVFSWRQNENPPRLTTGCEIRRKKNKIGAEVNGAKWHPFYHCARESERFFSGPKPASRERVFPKIHVYLQLFPPLALRFPVERKKIDGGLSENGDGERAGREKENGEIGEKAEA